MIAPAKVSLARLRLRDRTLPKEESYDLTFDPTEQCNLAPQPGKLLDQMRTRLDDWMHRTNDPLLRGPVPAPPGAKVNPVDGISPRKPGGREMKPTRRHFLASSLALSPRPRRRRPPAADPAAQFVAERQHRRHRTHARRARPAGQTLPGSGDHALARPPRQRRRANCSSATIPS